MMRKLSGMGKQKGLGMAKKTDVLAGQKPTTGRGRENPTGGDRIAQQTYQGAGDRGASLRGLPLGRDLPRPRKRD